jgi:hypothetical protein
MALPLIHAGNARDTPPSRAEAQPHGHQSGRLALRGDPTELHRHRAHCAAARHQLHGLQSAVEALDAFLSPRFFSMLAVLGAGALLVFWFSA